MVDFEKLHEKGWEEEHIRKAKYILERDPQRNYARKLNKFVYWTTLIIAIIGNFIVNFALVPVFISTNIYLVIFTLILVGGSFGFLFTVILHDLEMVDPKHHIIAGVFLPVFAGIVSYVTVTLSNDLAIASGSQILVTQNVILIPLIYVLAFTLPYFNSLKKIYGL